MTNRTDVLDKAQLSPDEKAKIKAVLNLQNAIEFMSLEESEDNEEGPVIHTQAHQATMLREVKVKKQQCCSLRLLWGAHVKEKIGLKQVL